MLEIRLTDAGRMLAIRAEEILGRLDAAAEDLAAYTGLRAGRVRLAAFPSALGTFVPVAAAAFSSAHPRVELRFTEAEPPEAVRLVRTGEVDVALLFSYRDPPEAQDDGVRRTVLLDEPNFLITPAALPGDTLAAHSGARWIAGCERCRSHLLAGCAAAGFTPDVAVTTDDYVAVQALVAAGFGVATLPGLALAAHRRPGVRAVRLPGQTRQVSAAVYGAAPDPPATTALLDHLRTAAAGALST